MKARGIRAIVVNVDEEDSYEVIERLTLLGLVVAADHCALVQHDADVVDVRLVPLEVVSCEGEGG